MNTKTSIIYSVTIESGKSDKVDGVALDFYTLNDALTFGRFWISLETELRPSKTDACPPRFILTAYKDEE